MLSLPARGMRPGPARLSLRANAARVRTEGAGVAGTVASSAYLGDHVEYEIDGPLGRVFVVDDNSDVPLAVGTGVVLELRARGLALIPGDA